MSKVRRQVESGALASSLHWPQLLESSPMLYFCCTNGTTIHCRFLWVKNGEESPFHLLLPLVRQAVRTLVFVIYRPAMEYLKGSELSQEAKGYWAVQPQMIPATEKKNNTIYSPSRGRSKNEKLDILLWVISLSPMIHISPLPLWTMDKSRRDLTS